jgi:hypothetical protein
MLDGIYWADCRINGGIGPYPEKRNFRIFLNYHFWDLMNTKLHHLHCLRNIANRVSGSRSLYRLNYPRCNFFATSGIYRRCGSLHRSQSCLFIRKLKKKKKNYPAWIVNSQLLRVWLFW